MTKLSVNINKIAVVRNSRGGNLPDVVRAALDCERFGAQGITVHPRPDARHIRYSDVRDLKKVLTTEFNIEGNPIPSFRELVLEVRPAQVTLVPDAENAITSNAGWNTVKYRDFLREVTAEFQARGIRVSIFVDPVAEMVAGAKECGAILPGTRVEVRIRVRGKKHSFNSAVWFQGNIRGVQWSTYGEVDLLENPATNANPNGAWQTFHWNDISTSSGLCICRSYSAQGNFNYP